jgi:hypothetical protein
MDRNHRRVALALFAWVFLTHAYFYNGASWNQNARYDAIYAFVEPGTADTHTFRIDRFVVDPGHGRNTGDWARHDGHYYSNKNIGTALLGIPLYTVLYHAERELGLDPAAASVSQLNAYVLNLWVSVFWTALAAAMLFLFLCERWRHPRDAVAAAAFFACGTLMLPFDTQLWGHTTAASLTVIGLVLLQRESARPRQAILAGCVLGLAVFCDYLAGLSLIAIVMLTLSMAAKRRLVPWLVLGGVPWAVALLLYHKVAFGSCFTTSSSHSNPMFTESTLVLGQFGLPDPRAIWSLLFSMHRGLFTFTPALLLVFVGARGWPRKSYVILWAAAIASVLVIASFRDWHGGNATGPRYLIFSLPFWCLLMPRISRLSYRMRRIALALMLVSGIEVLLVAAITPMMPPTVRDPWPMLVADLVHGDFPKHTWLTHMTRNPTGGELAISTFNAGNALGLRAKSSLVPYLLLLLAGFAVIWRRSSYYVPIVPVGHRKPSMAARTEDAREPARFLAPKIGRSIATGSEGFSFQPTGKENA